MESHWEVKEGEFALKYVTLPHGRKYISDTSLATGRTSIDYTATRPFFTTTFNFLCAHQNEKSLYLSETSLHLPLSFPGENFNQEKSFCYTPLSKLCWRSWAITRAQKPGHLYTSGDRLCYGTCTQQLHKRCALPTLFN